MPYYIRLLTPSVEIPPFDELELAIGPDAELTLEAGGPESWDQLLLSLDDGTHVAVIERNPVEGDGSLGAAELAEFGEKIATCRPETSARWLASYLPGVETIYAFQLLSGADTEEGREALDELRGEMWMELGGILQADAEGFSNEDGYHILWQFGEGVTGRWNMGLLVDGEWVHFEMDLGDPAQREAFENGEVP